MDEGENLKSEKLRVLIICTHVAVDRSRKKDNDTLQPMAGVYVASLLDPEQCDVELYHEIYSGPYDIHGDEQFDLVFLSGLQKEFDRMKQLSYVFKSRHTAVIAGGSICTLYPEYCAEFFDAVCAGGVESAAMAVNDFKNGKLQKIYRTTNKETSSLKLDYGLLRRSGISTEVHLVEASRGCNYKCNFCSIPAENVRHSVYGLDTTMHNIRNAISNVGPFNLKFWYPFVYFIDNHFTINKRHVRELCAQLKSEKRLRKWGALFSQDMLADRELVDLLADSKCMTMFVGIESLDHEFLARVNKRQNLKKLSSLMDNIDYAQSKGIIIMYGYLFDPKASTVKSMTAEMNNLYNNPILTFPTFFSFISPLIGTGTFWDSAEKGEFLPNLNLRDLDGSTVAFRHSKDDKNTLTEFARILFADLSGLVEFSSVLKKTLKYIIRYRMFHPVRMYMVYRTNTRPFRRHRTTTLRNYIGGEDILDPQYLDLPDGISEEDRLKYFTPTKVTDENGQVASWLRKDTVSNNLIEQRVELSDIKLKQVV